MVKLSDFCSGLVFALRDFFSKLLPNKKTQGQMTRNSPIYSFKMYQFQSVISKSDSNRIPQPRSGHRIVCDSVNLYSFGGYNPSLQPAANDALLIGDDPEERQQTASLFQELWRFNLLSKEWYRYTGRQTLPHELASNAVVLKGNTLMVYGGTGAPFGHRCSNHLYVCRVDDDEGLMSKFKTSGDEPIPLYGQALIYHQGYLYTIGGTTGFDYTCDIHRLDLRTGVWESVYICRGYSDYEPEGRYRHEVAFDGSDIYILGGGTAENAFGFAKLPVFNLETRKWEKRKSYKDPIHKYPKKRRCHGAAQLRVNDDIHVFIVGGFDGHKEFNDVWRLELESLRWTKIETCVLPRPTYFHSCAVTPEGKLYVFGGIYRCKDDETKRSNDVYSAWVCVPKLSEICWEAVLTMQPHLRNFGQDQLCALGIPMKFVHRLMAA